MPDNKKYYDILGIDPDSSIGDIKNAYRKIVKRYHPDSLGPNATLGEKRAAEEYFKRIQEAYETVCKEAERRNVTGERQRRNQQEQEERERQRRNQQEQEERERQRRSQQEQEERERQRGHQNGPSIFWYLLIILGGILVGITLLPYISGYTEKTVEKGDKISVNYIGSFEEGKVFDTSIESVAKANDLFSPDATYEPFNFNVGKTPSEAIEGFEEGVIGMKVGETKHLIIPPEKAYPINSSKIHVIPIEDNIPTITVIPREIKVSAGQFEQVFGPNHSVGETVQIPDSNMNITITNISSEMTLEYNLTVGFKIWNEQMPWNATVIKIDDKNFSVKPDVKINDIVQFQNLPYNTTIVDMNDENITLRNNPIPETETEVPDMFGQMVPTKIKFNETSIIMDQNSKVAGKTLLFNITLVSINK
jgi:FKBP-type peptidyl-prolyl cis-trans isomerase 2